MKTCPFCKREYDGYPALSRREDQTEICPDCGMAEALEAFGLTAEKSRRISIDINTFIQKFH